MPHITIRSRKTSTGRQWNVYAGDHPVPIFTLTNPAIARKVLRSLRQLQNAKPR